MTCLLALAVTVRATRTFTPGGFADAQSSAAQGPPGLSVVDGIVQPSSLVMGYVYRPYTAHSAVAGLRGYW